MPIGLRLEVVFLLDFEDGALGLVGKEVQSHFFVLFFKLIGFLIITHGKRILSQSDVSRLLNKSRGWVRDRLEVKKDGITVEALAMKLAKEFV